MKAEKNGCIFQQGNVLKHACEVLKGKIKFWIVLHSPTSWILLKICRKISSIQYTQGDIRTYNVHCFIPFSFHCKKNDTKWFRNDGWKAWHRMYRHMQMQIKWTFLLKWTWGKENSWNHMKKNGFFPHTQNNGKYCISFCNDLVTESRQRVNEICLTH